MQTILQSLLGIAVFLLLAVLFSKDRGRICWRSVAKGVACQFVIAFTFLGFDPAAKLLGYVTSVAKLLQVATQSATSFVLGYVGGGEAPFETLPGSSTFIFAFQVLPVILVLGALSALLWHWRVLGYIVAVGAWIVRKVLGVSEPVGFASVANAFLGMIEAPLLIKPYLKNMATNELFMVMCVGLSTIAGGTAVVIGSIFSNEPTVFSNVITATLMNVPGALVFSSMLFPACLDREATGSGPSRVEISSPYKSSMEAIVFGTADGVKIFVNVVSLLIVFLALVALIDSFLSVLVAGLSLSTIFSYILAPLAWLIGIRWEEAFAASEILSLKVAVNEIVAYMKLSEQFDQLTTHAQQVLTFALCGFGNFGSVAIMIGGLSAMAPERKAEIISLGTVGPIWWPS